MAALYKNGHEVARWTSVNGYTVYSVRSNGRILTKNDRFPRWVVLRHWTVQHDGVSTPHAMTLAQFTEYVTRRGLVKVYTEHD